MGEQAEGKSGHHEEYETEIENEPWIVGGAPRVREERERQNRARGGNSVGAVERHPARDGRVGSGGRDVEQDRAKHPKRGPDERHDAQAARRLFEQVIGKVAGVTAARPQFCWRAAGRWSYEIVVYQSRFDWEGERRRCAGVRGYVQDCGPWSHAVPSVDEGSCLDPEI